MAFLNAPRLGSLLVLAMLSFACQPTDSPTPTLEVSSLTDASLMPTIIPQAYRPAAPTTVPTDYVFDWENAAYLPGPASAAQVPMPWSANAVRAFSEDIRADYKQADGWELLHNTSGTQGVTAHRLLVLYNRFRGLLRCYYYLDGTIQNIAGNNITTCQLSVDGTSPLLNYDAQAVTDVSTNSQTVAFIEPQGIQQGAWYAFQHVIAYDPELAQQRFDKLAIRYRFSSDQLTRVGVGGRQTAQVAGRFKLDGTDVTRLPATVSANGRFVVYGTHDRARLQSSGVSVDWLSRYLTETGNYNLLNGILVRPGGTGSSVIEWNEAVQLTRPPVNGALLVAPVFSLPGYDQSRSGSFPPQFNEAPGVFYLAARPRVRTQVVGNQPYSYTLDVPSVRYLFNPALTNSASIEQLRQEIIATAQNETTTGQPTYYTGTTLTANQPLNVVGVRVSFNVVPKNGSAPVHIVKTFRADVSAN